MKQGTDDEFRKLFGEEARERVARLTSLLLELDTADPGPEALAAVFREAHTLKGGAAMVGLDRVRDVAHALEDVLEAVRGGSQPLGPELVDVLLQVADGLGGLVRDAVAGSEHDTEADRLLAVLAGNRVTGAGP